MDNYILNEIDIDKNHIDNFVLDTEEGTKKMKEAFHVKACNERNAYVNSRKEVFLSYQKFIYEELNRRNSNMAPEDMTETFNNRNKELDKMLYIIKLNNNYMTSSYKLGLDFLLSQISNNVSLDTLKDIIDRILNVFRSAKINFSINDFKYTMYCEKFMNVYFNDVTNLEETFHNLFFECPNLVIQLKYNLKYIINKYQKELDVYTEELLNKYLEEENSTKDNILKKYIVDKQVYDIDFSHYDFNNVNIFLSGKKKISDYLDGAGKDKIFNTYDIKDDFNNEDDKYKGLFYKNCDELYSELLLLKEYYRYEDIIKDLIRKYGNIDKSITEYNNLVKEYKKEDGKRAKLYASYLKTIGVGFLARKNREKEKIVSLEMNKEIDTIVKLNEDIDKLKLATVMKSYLNDASSIYDFFIISFTNYPYLEKLFSDMFSEDESFTLESECDRYFRFLTNPYNDFLRDVRALTNYDLATILAEKYKLLGLEVSSEDFKAETLDVTISNIEYIKLINDINNSRLKINDVNFIYNVTNLAPLTEEDNSEENSEVENAETEPVAEVEENVPAEETENTDDQIDEEENNEEIEDNQNSEDKEEAI